MLNERLIAKTIQRGTRALQRRVRHRTGNRYLEGLFAPVSGESTATQLQVRGRIPSELNGLYARIGPNPLQVDNPAVYRWFTGDGMVHGVRLRDGQALWYRNRWIGTDSVNRRLGRPLAPGPRHGVADVVNTNIVGHAGRIWALVEAGALPVQLDAELSTVRHGYFDSPATQSYSAHPHRDPQSGELHAICYDPLERHQIRHVVVDRNGSVTRDLAVPVRHGPMIHDCALTARHVVIFDLPITFSLGALLRGASLPYRWNGAHIPRIGLLPRTGSAAEVRWFEIEACYVFHAANAYELDDGTVVVDVISYPRQFEQARGTGLDNSRTRLERWRLDPTTSVVRRGTLSEHRQEFPRIDERRTTQPHRFIYTVGFGEDQPRPEPLYRHDLHSGSTARHDFGPTQVPSEAVFVPRSAQGAEDEGWLLAFVGDLASERSALVILDAAHVQDEPQAVIELPARVPLGFHGNWIPDTA
jgi:8'-apo-carotenoid 13,14-cleaving dioxygenase